MAAVVVVQEAEVTHLREAVQVGIAITKIQEDILVLSFLGVMAMLTALITHTEGTIMVEKIHNVTKMIGGVKKKLKTKKKPT